MMLIAFIYLLIIGLSGFIGACILEIGKPLDFDKVIHLIQGTLAGYGVYFILCLIHEIFD